MTTVHPSAIVGDGVKLGERVVIGPHAVILGPVEIGDDCWIGPGCVIGTPPEITSIEHNDSWHEPLELHGVHIGARTVVRELSTIHQGSYRPTTIGSDCWLLNRVYVGHDCHLGDGVTLSAGTSIGGHVRIGDRVNLGMNAAVHQRRVIAPGAMVGMGAVVTKDVPPYAKVFGNPAGLHGVNTVGMTRACISGQDIDQLTARYAGHGGLVDFPAPLATAFHWWNSAEPVKPLVPITVPMWQRGAD